MLRTGSRALALIALCVLPAFAAGKVLGTNASITAQRVMVGESFEIVVSVEVEGDGNDLPWPEVQLPAGISLGGKNRSQESRTQISMVNGSFEKKSTTVVRFHMRLNTTKAGTFPLGPVTFQGRNLGAGQIVVGDPPAASRSAGGGANGSAANTGATSNEIRASTLVGKRTIYVGQQLPFTWRLESSLPLQITSFPDIRSTLGQGFYSASPDSQGQAKVVSGADGRSFARLDWKGTLFPLRPGRQNLPATKLGWRTIEGGSVDPFEAMMRGEDPFEAMQRQPRVREGVAQTQVIGLEILPIPEKNRPASFQGGVGHFSLSAELQAPNPRVGQSATLVMRLSGNGQPQASGLPVWNAPDAMEAYPPQDTWKSVWKDGEFVTTLERRIVLVPRKAGRIELDSVRFSWFDPAQNRFQTASQAIPTLTVADAPRSNMARAPGDTAGSATRLSGSDRFWITFGRISAVIWSILLATAILWGLFRALRSRFAPKAKALRRLKEIDKRLAVVAARTTPDPGALRRIVVDALVVLLGEDAAGWTSQEVRERVGSGWTELEADDVASLLRDLEAAQFAGFPVEDGMPRTRAMIATTRRIISAP